MTEPPGTQNPFAAENDRFFEKTERAFRDLFDRARTKNEVHFVFSLNPEFRSEQDAGWSTADDAHIAFTEYLAFLTEGELRVVGGQPYNLWPFQDLVEAHRKTGATIAPNANKVLRDLAGHATTLGLSELAEVFGDAFDPDIRNAYAHADYIIWKDGLRLRKRNGGLPQKIPWPEFQARFDRGVNVFHLLSEIVDEYVASYNPARQFRGRRADNEPEFLWTVHFDPERKAFGISCGLG